ncbi:L-lysine 6-transaminase precursor [Friedmanniella luteola]|uniref:L-lysine-epsilon aminotransferase n=1 Tax=Friedmanniella luteola TaxID=546871 RepID=A0A1H1YMP5_9ACTN|nr:L-lysine 6-transaminase [Friedmanniella luteola]SDT22748.1 L-lysine 6-transaminase precursor [Friedmanniella luteola]
MAEQTHVSPAEVHEVLGRHVLTDGMKLVVDLRRSRGSCLVDARTGQRYLDLYTFFASAPLGINPPGLADDPTFLAELGEIAANKPANPDMYTTAYAEFVATFVRVLGDPALPHLFFVEGGALAVENALKAAFDWKSRHNEAAGRDRRLGTKVLHLTHAFHGRSGYTLSLTNTDPGKTDRFPQFDWPRIDVPAVRFPLADHLEEVEAAERHALEQARRAFAAHPHDIAAFIAEPIQGEGGDHHIRAEFFAALREIVHAHDALFIFDEVQTGVGTTGSAWAYQQLGVQPDLVAFSKKAQVGGVMAGGRIDEVPDNVFTVSGRINSTWGGGLTDMVRSRRLLEIIEAEGLIEQAGPKGERLLAGLRRQAATHGLVDNVRGRGLFAACDLPDAATRAAVLSDLHDVEHVIVLPCGARSLRFRPALSITEDEIDEAVAAVGRSLARTAASTRQLQESAR